MKDSRSTITKESSKQVLYIYIGAVVLCLLVAIALTLTILKLSGPGISAPVTPSVRPTAANTTEIDNTPTPDPSASQIETVKKPDFVINNIDYSTDAIKEGIFTVIDDNHPASVVSMSDLILLKAQSDMRVMVSVYKTYLTEDAYKAINSLQTDLSNEFSSGMNILIFKTISLAEDGDISESEYDEHCTGNAMDVRFMDNNRVSYKFTDSKVFAEYEWIRQNAWRYGLIFRYTSSKTEITGHDAEIGHLRYVGVPAAKYMYENDLCLEEFLSELKEYTFNSPLVLDTPEGLKYRIYYTAIENSGKTKIYYRSESESENYGDIIVSGNGDDGFLVIQEFSEKS